jgi:signal transduction histidine kinase
MPGGGFVTIYTDLTERKATEEQLRQAQKMEIVGQLTGGIAHDFNNLLAVIMGSLNMLQERLAEQPDLRKQARRALEAADRGALLTQRLLAFSRKQALQPQELDINDLVEAMLDLLEYSVGETVTIRTELAVDLWRLVIDPGQLENSLMNLAVNSRDAMPACGELTITTANLTVPESDTAAALEPGDYVTLAVTDTGSGMPPEVLHRVFEPFYTTKEVGQGTGLGLSVSYGIAEEHGGELRAENLARGARFTLVLPVGEPAGLGPPVPAETPRSLGELPLERMRKILVSGEKAP